MTQARTLLVPANAHGIYHCVSRCVRRAWLCGQDPLTGADHEDRRQWVEDRLAQLAELPTTRIAAARNAAILLQGEFSALFHHYKIPCDEGTK